MQKCGTLSGSGIKRFCEWEWEFSADMKSEGDTVVVLGFKKAEPKKSEVGPMKIHHLNCGVLHAPPNPQASCHCLLLEGSDCLTLIDTGIGLQDIAYPLERIGQTVIDAAGFQFHEELTAARQIERLGFRPEDVTDVVLTHADPDHAGGLADFPGAAVHISGEELARLEIGHWRYSPAQFLHQPRWVTHPPAVGRWFGLEARPLPLSTGGEVLLVPLFGHTLGHCGVAVRDRSRWLLHVGDAYYLRVELSTDDHPVSALAALRADDDVLRRASLAELRRLGRDHGAEIEMFGYHDFTEFSPDTLED
jgi:glyoxylase-like metal-dependent hydrolase (beta-lactamase superfamily II)